MHCWTFVNILFKHLPPPWQNVKKKEKNSEFISTNATIFFLHAKFCQENQNTSFHSFFWNSTSRHLPLDLKLTINAKMRCFSASCDTDLMVLLNTKQSQIYICFHNTNFMNQLMVSQRGSYMKPTLSVKFGYVGWQSTRICIKSVRP